MDYRLEARIKLYDNPLLDKSAEVLIANFQQRQLCRSEYRFWCRAYRLNLLLLPCRGRYFEQRLSGHLFDVSQTVQGMKRKRHLACEDYTPVSDAYADYQAEHITDYYSDLQLQEIERRVSLYHLGYEDA